MCSVGEVSPTGYYSSSWDWHYSDKGNQISNPSQVLINEFNSVSSPGMTQVKNIVVKWLLLLFEWHLLAV